MKNEDVSPSQIGIFNIPRSAAHPNDKVLKVFNTLKRRAKQNETLSHSSGQVTPSHEDMQYRAMNSYRVGPEVIKTDNDFEVV